MAKIIPIRRKALNTALRTRMVYVRWISMDKLRALQAAGFTVIIKQGRSF